MPKFICLLILGIFLMSCSTLKVAKDQSVDLGQGAFLYLKQPQDILPDLQLVQVLSIENKGKKNSSQVVLTSRENKISVVALLPLGGEAFRVEYSGGEIRSKSMSVMDSKFDLKFALADILLIYAEKKSLESWLSPGVQVVDGDKTRDIVSKNRVLIHVQYSDQNRYKSEIDYEHLIRDYRLHITPLSGGLL